jgi:twitching motility protein PilT
MDINEILRIAVKAKASDIHLKAGLPPIFRIDNMLMPLKNAERIPINQAREIANSFMSEKQLKEFKEKLEVDFGLGIPGVGRFRVNVFQQRGNMGMVFRVIPFDINLNFTDLYLPKVLEKVSLEPRGLVLVTGTTGSGKSTTLAAMIEYINTRRTCHIITIEDPIEFLHRDKNSIITQREIGVDTNSFAAALRSALRQDPDVILVGEMRDIETIETALMAAETGHLVMSTLHTLDATETVNRIIAVFPPHQQRQIRIQLSVVLRSVISQRLMPRADGKGRVPAVEVLIGTKRVRELIEDREKTKMIPEAISQGFTIYGMQTFDQSLMSLYKRNIITYDEALTQSSNPADFALKVKGISSTSDSTWDDFDKGGGDGESDEKSPKEENDIQLGSGYSDDKK